VTTGRELPGIRPEVHKTTRTQKIGWLVLAAIALGVFLIWFISALANDTSTTPSNNAGKYESIAQCEARIENLLKSPATADFDTDASGAGSSWTVTGTVDSENGFGALVRSDFQCTVSLQGEGATTAVDFLE
jgi:hypothetical protein